MRFRPGAPIMLVILLGACATTASPAVDATPPSARRPVATPVGPDSNDGPERIVGRSALDRPPQPMMSAAYRADLVSDHCVDRDLPTPPASHPHLSVLDRSHGLPIDYVPGDLVAASAAGLNEASGTRLVSAVMVDDLAAMVGAWEAAGLRISIDSAYRSYASQAATFEMWVARVGSVEALDRTALPGHSEHQLGTALDLSSPGWSGRFGDWATEAAEGAWMAATGWEYGFVMSYPNGEREATCFPYEPWHYRWIGREEAAAHRASGLDLRRFLERYVGP